VSPEPPLTTTDAVAEEDDDVELLAIVDMVDEILLSVDCWRRSRTGAGRRLADVRARERDRSARLGSIILVGWRGDLGRCMFASGRIDGLDVRNFSGRKGKENTETCKILILFARNGAWSSLTTLGSK
jgi:hypothetical protein